MTEGIAGGVGVATELLGDLESAKWGPLLGGALLCVILLAVGWRWMVRHEGALRQWWRSFLARPPVAAFTRRFERELRFLQNRFTPGGLLGLQLTVSVLMILAGVWLFVEIADELIENAAMVTFDHQVSDWMQRHATPGTTRVAYFITDLGSVGFIASASAVVVAVLAYWRSWCRLLAYSLAVFGGGLLNYLLKVSFGRARPVFENPLVTLDSYSFPSGHTMGSTLFYGALALSVLLYAERWRWRWRVLAVLVAALLVMLIGWTRIYLGAHFLSDIMGALTIGLAWLMTTHIGVELLRHRKQEKEKSRAAAGSASI